MARPMKLALVVRSVTFLDVLEQRITNNSYSRRVATSRRSMLKISGLANFSVENLDIETLAGKENAITGRLIKSGHKAYYVYQICKQLELLLRYYQAGYLDGKGKNKLEVTMPKTTAELTIRHLLFRYCEAKKTSDETSQNYVIRLRRSGWLDLPLRDLTPSLLVEKLANLNALRDDRYWWGKQAAKALSMLVDFGISCGYIDLEPAQANRPRILMQREPKSSPLPTIQRDRLTTGITFGEMFRAYIDHHAKDHCRTWRNLERSYAYVKHWNEVIAGNLTRLDVQELHNQLGAKNGITTANRVIQLIRTIYKKATLWEIYEGRNPGTGVSLFRLQSRDRFLSTEEIAIWLNCLSQMRDQTVRDFLLLALLTAARRSNVAAMRWKEVDFKNRMWKIPITKNGTSQNVPLTSWAMRVLEERRKSRYSEWVFPSERSISGHLSKPEEAWQNVKRKTGLADIRMHDLRRTLASYEAITGANISVIAATLNHKDLKSTMIYARLHLDPIREAMETATAQMFSGVTSPKSESPKTNNTFQFGAEMSDDL